MPDVSPLEYEFCREIVKPGATIKKIMTPHLNNFVLYLYYPKRMVKVQVPLLNVMADEPYNQMISESLEKFANLYFFLQRLECQDFIELERFSIDTHDEFLVGKIDKTKSSVVKDVVEDDIKNMLFDLFFMTFKPKPMLDVLIELYELQKIWSN